MRTISNIILAIVCLVTLTAPRAHAQTISTLTDAEKITLKAAIVADQTASDLYAAGNADGLATYYNEAQAPDFWVWRSAVSEGEYTGAVSVDGTTWSWTTYIARSVAERDAWERLFESGYGFTNPSLDNVRQGVNDIFSGAGGAAQRTHLLASSRRKATRFEKVFATGTGSTASPGKLWREGQVTYDVFVGLP